mgnify:FL=1
MIFAGWTVVYRNAKKIASRNETFSLIGRIRDSVQKVEDYASDYYTDTDENRIDSYLWEGKLLAKIDSIRTDAMHLQSRNISLNNLRIVDLRRTATLNAEQVTKMDNAQKRQKITEVKAAGTQLLNELDAQFLTSNTFLKP